MIREQVDERVEGGTTGNPSISATLTRREQRFEFTIGNIDDIGEYNNANRDKGHAYRSKKEP